MVREVWVAGFPSYYGGADTELDHTIDVFRQFGLEVNLVPMFGCDERMRVSVLERGCKIFSYREDIFGGKTVISYCNGQFLSKLPMIMKAAPPVRVIWFNCMTHTFEAEKQAHAHGWIDYFGFQTEYQKRCLMPQLEALGPVRTFPYVPFFNVHKIPWRYRQWDGSYRVGRISRDDMHKFAADTWRIFDRVLVPNYLKKKVFILGYGPNAAKKTGPPPPSLDWLTWSPGAIPAAQFYNTIDTMIHKTGGSRENYPRVLLEAWAHGVVPVVEHDYAFPELVVHGETGFMTSCSDEMSYYASMLAMNPKEHRRIAENGRKHLENRLACPDACWQSWSAVL